MLYFAFSEIINIKVHIQPLLLNMLESIKAIPQLCSLLEDVNA